MDDLNRLEQEKDKEVASLAAKITGLEALAQTKKIAFERETQHLKELFDLALGRLEGELKNSQSKMAADVKEADARLGEWEERLKHILAETDIASLDKKLKNLQASISAESPASAAAMLEAASKDLKDMRGQIESRIIEKESQISRLREEFLIKEKELSAMNARQEEQRNALLAGCKAALEKKEKATGEALNYLQMELAKRTRRLGEVAKIVEAREIWLETEKTKRLDSLKALMAEIEAHGRGFHDTMVQEKAFWDSQLKSMDQEAVNLNMNLVTGQAQMAAVKTKHEEEIRRLEASHQEEVANREKIFIADVVKLRGTIEQANKKIRDLVASLKSTAEANKRETENLEKLCATRQEQALREINSQEANLALIRQEHADLIAAKTEEMNRLKAEYEAKVLAPTIETKKRNIEELELKRKSIETKLTDLEQSRTAERTALEQEMASCEEEIKLLEGKLAAQARINQERVKEMTDKTAELLAPYAARLGELKKAIEMALAKHKEEIAALDERKANINLEVDRLRYAFETTAEEKRRELLFAVDNLKAQYQSQQERLERERGAWRQSLSEKKKELSRINAELGTREAAFRADLEKREREIQNARAFNQDRIRSLESELDGLKKTNEDQISRRHEETARAEERGKNILADLKAKWSAQEFEIEKEKAALLEAINRESQAFAERQEQLKAELSGYDKELAQSELILKKKNEEWQALIKEIEERRLAVVVPLERQVQALEESKARTEAAGRERLDSLTERAAALAKSVADKRGKFEHETDLRKKSLSAEIAALTKKLTAARDEAARTLENLQARASGQKSTLSGKQRELVELSSSIETRRSAAQTSFKREEERSRELAGKAQAALAAAQKRLNQLQAIKKQEAAALTEEAQRLTLERQERLAALEGHAKKEKEGVERKISAQTEALSSEIARLEAQVADLDAKVKDRSVELDVMKNQQEIEISELERGRRRIETQIKSKRGEIAQDIKGLRRAYREKMRESEHELYLAQLKLQLRTKRLEELMKAKRQDLETTKTAWAARAESSLDNLRSKMEQLSRRAETRRQELQAMETKDHRLKSEFDKRKTAFISDLDSRKRLLKEREVFQERARQSMEQFRGRMEELLSGKETQKAKIYETLEKIEPLGKELSVTLGDFLLTWEKEVRRLYSSIKNLEDSSYWRHH
ncbi:MAG: hypothetical protein HY401_04525 [Elusimicrobia bacterium]|nr:hypothetical protein [Elusimicrobiota bacterium]